jgi:hypothetical protein
MQQEPKFEVGQKVTMTNCNGVRYVGKTIAAIDATETGFRYFITPTDTPWFSVHEKNLSAAEPLSAVTPG